MTGNTYTYKQYKTRKICIIEVIKTIVNLVLRLNFKNKKPGGLKERVDQKQITTVTLCSPMHSVTSPLGFKILKLIHFQKKLSNGDKAEPRGAILPLPL